MSESEEEDFHDVEFCRLELESSYSDQQSKEHSQSAKETGSVEQDVSIRTMVETAKSCSSETEALSSAELALQNVLDGVAKPAKPAKPVIEKPSTLAQRLRPSWLKRSITR